MTQTSPSGSRRHVLEDWRQFLLADSHILRVRPGVLLQQAANMPDDADPARAARRRLESADHARPWLRWANKPQTRPPNLMTIAGHAKGVNACAFSPDGVRLASASEDATVRLWNAETGAEILTLAGHTLSVTACAFSSDGARLVSGSEDGTLRIWDAATGQPVHVLEAGVAVTCVAWSPDGWLVASGGADRCLKLWDARSGTEAATLAGHDKPIRACAFSPDGALIVSGAGLFVKVWEVASRQERAAGTWRPRPLSMVGDEHEGVECCAFSPDGGFVVSGTGKRVRSSFGRVYSKAWGELSLWDSGNGRRTRTLPAHDGIVRACAWSPDGRRVASGADDGRVKIWDTDTWSDLVCLDAHTNLVTACAFSPDSARLASASADGTLKLWLLERATATASLMKHPGASICRVSPDGAAVVTGSSEGSVVVWDMARHTARHKIEALPDAVVSIGLSPDGALLALGTGPGSAHNKAAAAELRVFETRSGRVLAAAEWDEAGGVPFSEFTADGSRVVSGWGGWNNTQIRILAPGSPARLRSWAKAQRLSLHAAVLPGGRWLAVASPPSLEVRDLETGESVSTIEADEPFERLPDGRGMVFGRASKPHGHELFVWAIGEPAPRVRMTGHDRAQSYVDLCAVSPDGRRLVSATGRRVRTSSLHRLLQGVPGELKLWDVRSGAELAMVRDEHPFSQCAFSRDARFVIACTDDGRIRIWNVETLNETATYFLGSKHRALDLGRSGQQIAVVDSFGRVHILAPTGFAAGVPFVTAEHVYDFDVRAWDADPSCVCPWCSCRFAVEAAVRDVLTGILRDANLSAPVPLSLALSVEAWGDPALRAECPHCRGSLRFNPFVADLRELAAPAVTGSGRDNRVEPLAAKTERWLRMVIPAAPAARPAPAAAEPRGPRSFDGLKSAQLDEMLRLLDDEPPQR